MLKTIPWPSVTFRAQACFCLREARDKRDKLEEPDCLAELRSRGGVRSGVARPVWPRFIFAYLSAK